MLDIEPSTLVSPNLKVCDVITSNHRWDVKTIHSLVMQENIVQKIIGTPLPLSSVQILFVGVHRLRCIHHQDNYMDGP